MQKNVKMNKLLYVCRSLAAILIIGVPAFCNGQGNDIKITANYHPDSKYLPPADSTSRDGNSRQIEAHLTSHLNLYTKIDTIKGKAKMLNAAIMARHTSFSNGGFNKDILPTDLYALGIGLSYYATINKKWAYTLLLNTSLNTDFEAVDYNDMFVTGGVIFIRQFSPNLRLGMGGIIHNNLGTPMFWPALSVYWHFGRRFSLDINVPDEGQGISYKIGIAYKVSEKFKAGFAFKPQVISYDVEPRFAINNRLMNFWQLPFELSASYASGNFEYNAAIGFTALRRFAYAEKDLKNMFTEYPYHGLGSNLFFGTGVTYKF